MPNYTLYCPDNNSSMCGSADKLFLAGVPLCDACGFKTDLYYVNSQFSVSQRQYDLSSTYDGYKIASRKFVEACRRLDIEGAAFIAIPSEPDFFVLKHEATTAFDSERRKTSFESYCRSCHTYKAVAGASPAFLLEEPTHDLSGTDVVFGSGNSRSRLLIATERAKTLLSHESLRGLEFSVIAHNNTLQARRP